MNKEDYFKYYIQGSDHYLIPKDEFKELFNEMSNWREDTNKYKEVIDKLKKAIDECWYMDSENIGEQIFLKKCELKDILKEVE